MNDLALLAYHCSHGGSGVDRDERQGCLPALRLPDLLRGASLVRRSAFSLQGVPQGFQPNQRHSVRVPQDAAADLPGRDRDLLQRGPLALSRDLDVQYKTAWVLAHKLREALSTEVKGYKLGGEGKVVEVDGAYFGGYVKPANLKEHRVDRRFVRNQTGKRQCVVVIRQRDGMVLPSAFKTEAIGHQVYPPARRRRDRDHGGRCELVERPARALPRLSVSTTRSPTAWTARARTGQRVSSLAVSAAPRLATITTSPVSTWPATRRKAHGARVIAGMTTAPRARGIVGLALAAKPSVDFCGYWQRAVV